MKFREEFVYPLHKSGGGEIVGAFNENTEPRDFCAPLGQGGFPLLAYLTGNGFGFFEHLSNKLVFRAKRMTLFTAKAGVGFL
jgi:hypothetical protein